ncbi:MAG: tRNA threonylcarbamoyladenosine dehydratase [Salinivirgaceae bacterium]|nr:tRNA threonylcarbamoyladenosine dehydratase [Salinivirgaceae bacterium]
MERNWLERTELLIGKEKLQALTTKHVLIVGLGGVGAYAAESITRAGIGELTIVDGDSLNISNINRQLPALHSTIGMPKAEVMANRLRDINPELKLHVINSYIKDDEMIDLLNNKYDYVVDAIDTISPKLFLIIHCVNRNLPIVSCMGAGGRLNPALVQVADISKSYNCTLARAIRKRLHQHGINKGIRVVFSSEKVDKAVVQEVENEQNKKTTVGTISYMTAIFGLYCAAEVIQNLLASEN